MQVSIAVWLPLAVATTWYLVRRRGTPPIPTALAVLAAASIGVITLTPAGWYALGNPAEQCSTDLVAAAAHLIRGPQELANIGMFVPLGLFAVLAGARPRVTAAVLTLAPGVLEIAQALAVHRICTVLDWLDNSVGGLIGVAAGVAVLAAREHRGDTVEAQVRPSRS